MCVNTFDIARGKESTGRNVTAVVDHRPSVAETRDRIVVDILTLAVKLLRRVRIQCHRSGRDDDVMQTVGVDLQCVGATGAVVNSDHVPVVPGLRQADRTTPDTVGKRVAQRHRGTYGATVSRGQGYVLIPMSDDTAVLVLSRDDRRESHAGRAAGWHRDDKVIQRAWLNGDGGGGGDDTDRVGGGDHSRVDANLRVIVGDHSPVGGVTVAKGPGIGHIAPAGYRGRQRRGAAQRSGAVVGRR